MHMEPKILSADASRVESGIINKLHGKEFSGRLNICTG